MQRATNAMRRAASARVARMVATGMAQPARTKSAPVASTTLGGERTEWRHHLASRSGSQLDMGKMTPAEIEAYVRVKREEYARGNA